MTPEQKQLVAILNSMPEHDYYAKAAEVISDFVSYSMSTLVFGSLALLFAFCQDHTMKVLSKANLK